MAGLVASNVVPVAGHTHGVPHVEQVVGVAGPDVAPTVSAVVGPQLVAAVFEHDNVSTHTGAAKVAPASALLPAAVVGSGKPAAVISLVLSFPAINVH